MSTQTQGGFIPKLTLGWRLQMALGNMSVQAMADQLGVSRASCARWMHDRGTAPRRAYILQWAMATGTDPVWLETGKDPQPGGPGGGQEECTRRDSNPKPSDPKVRVLRMLQDSAQDAA